MADMLEQKIGHPLAGANCAWVPSPTAATLHATHYHRVDVQRTAAGAGRRQPRRRSTTCSRSRSPRPSTGPPTSADAEVDNNVQGILGYVVRWIDQGVGCSKVPDINGVALMEDRATCRISSQHVANWLLHGVVTDERGATTRSGGWRSSSTSRTPATRSTCRWRRPSTAARSEPPRDLVFNGTEQPSGYTEPILHALAHRAEAVN